MKKIITTVFCTAIALCSGLNVYAAEILERDYTKPRFGRRCGTARAITVLTFPKPQYKHHLLGQVA